MIKGKTQRKNYRPGSLWPMDIVLLLILLLLHAFLVLGEVALVSARRTRLESEQANGNAAAALVLRLQDNIDHLLASLQIGIVFISLSEGAWAVINLAPKLFAWFSAHPQLASSASVLSLFGALFAIGLLVLIIAVLAPRFIGSRHAENIAMACAPALVLVSKLLSPLSIALNWMAKNFLRLLFIKPTEGQNISEEEIKFMVKKANQQGVIEAKESEYIQNVFRFADRDAYAVMTHRNVVEWLDINAPLAENDHIVYESGYTKFLVCDESIENILGVVKLRDYISQRNKPGFNIRNILSQPLFVLETMNAIKILERFRKERNYFAVVVDEYGSTQGILTLHDLTENIFGTLPDQDDVEEPSIVTREDGSLLVDGLILIDELRDTVDLHEFDAEEAEFTTLAGYILFKRAEIPEVGDYFEAEGYRFEIVDMDKSKIDKVLISKSIEHEV